MAFSVTPPSGSHGAYPHPSKAGGIDVKAAEHAYHLATENPEGRHVAVGILRPDGTTTNVHFGQGKPFSSLRVGSVTKTFTTFLALKLRQEGMIDLNTKCGDLIDRKTLASIFKDPDAAASMTLDQLLSHTSGLEYYDHNREFDPEQDNPKTMHERFLYEGKFGNKFRHTSKPGDHLGSYSNAGYAVAAWMLEIAYNKHKKIDPPTIPFSQIMRDELFTKVFHLSENSYISPGPNHDIMGGGLGDMTSSVDDLLKVAQTLQEGENHLEHYFGKDWQKIMLEPRDLAKHHGIGCDANISAIRHFGLNCQTDDQDPKKTMDVSAVVIFPLGKHQPGLVAITNSNALGPSQKQQDFADEIIRLADMPVEKRVEAKYDLNFFCPDTKSGAIFHGDAYVVTDKDPFQHPAPEKITLSRNGMKHVLHKKRIGKESVEYFDENNKSWLMISKGDRKMIYSGYCLVSPAPDIQDLRQPSLAKLKEIEGVYFDKTDNLTYTFSVRGGHLYFKEGTGDACPAMYLPEEDFWVVSLPEGRKEVKFRFPENKADPLILVDVSQRIPNPQAPIADKLPPFHSYKT